MQPEDFQTVQPLPLTTTSSAPEFPLLTRLRWPFWGPNGLRALWRLLIFVAIGFGLRFVIHRLLHRAGPVNDFTAKSALLQDGVGFLIVLGASALMGVFEERSLAAYGLPLQGAFGARFFEGLV